MEILNAGGAMEVNYHDEQGQLPFTQVFPLVKGKKLITTITKGFTEF